MTVNSIKNLRKFNDISACPNTAESLLLMGGGIGFLLFACLFWDFCLFVFVFCNQVSFKEFPGAIPSISQMQMLNINADLCCWIIFKR